MPTRRWDPALGVLTDAPTLPISTSTTVNSGSGGGGGGSGGGGGPTATIGGGEGTHPYMKGFNTSGGTSRGPSLDSYGAGRNGGGGGGGGGGDGSDVSGVSGGGGDGLSVVGGEEEAAASAGVGVSQRGSEGELPQYTTETWEAGVVHSQGP